jgi:putative ABC transport system permease protein
MNSLIFKSILRGFRRQKLVTLINLIGLSIGLTLVMLITVYLKNEFQTDRFHSNVENIYRVEAEIQSKTYPLTTAPMAEWLQDNFSEIKQSVRIFSPFYRTFSYVTVNNQSFDIKQPVFTDPSFFRIFSFPVLAGNVTDNFDNKNSVIITGSLAEKLYGSTDVVGKSLKYCDKYQLTVVAVVKNPPASSSITFELLLPFAGFNEYSHFDLSSWDRLTYQTFVVTKAQPEWLIGQVNQKIKEQFPDKEITYSLLPFRSIHFSPASTYDINFRHGNKNSLYLFLAIAVCVLVIAIINFINLSIATSSLRIKENSILKIEGAGYLQLSGRFIIESVMMSLFASAMALIFIEWLFPIFNSFFDNPPGRFQIRQPWFYLCLGLVGLVTGVVAGIYPATRFIHFQPVVVIKNKSAIKPGSRRWSNQLIIFQFAATIVLIISTLFFNKQMDFIQNQELGFDKEQILYFRLSDNLIKQKDVLVKQLETLPGINHVCMCDFVPGQPYSQRILAVNVDGGDKAYQIYHTKVSNGYLQTLGLNLVQGRNFNPASQVDENNYIVNESFLKEYGISNPFETVVDGSHIIGVVKDFNFYSLHQPIGPLTIRLTDGDQTTMMLRAGLSDGQDISQFITSIKEQVSAIVPESFVDVQPLDEQIRNQYIKETKNTKLLAYFSFFAILISCLGLFGMIVLITHQRIKEIGIRKVNGAKVSEILIMLNAGFIKWIILAFILAVPIAWYIINKWLQNFAYKTSLNWWIFALAGLIALGIALLTISVQSWRAATRNPVEALRYE